MDDKDPEHWLSYYHACGSYITSMHNQVIAGLSIQGALAFGCVAAMSERSAALGIGLVGAALQAVFVLMVGRLFAQCGAMCTLMSEIETSILRISAPLAMKTTLKASTYRLFTWPLMRRAIKASGVVLAVGTAWVGWLLSQQGATG